MSIKNAIKMFVKRWIPHVLYVRYDEKKSSMILKRLQHYKPTNILSLNIDSNYNTILSIGGFGYSGSGALIDILREYDSIDVLGHIEQEATKTSKKFEAGEIDFIRLSGGILDIERYIECNNIFVKDQVLHNFISLVENYPLFKSEEAINLVLEFLSEIIELRIDNLPKPAFNRYLKDPFRKDSILFLKSISVHKYRKIASSFINSLFNLYSPKESKILVPDQLFSDMEFDMDRNKEYIPNLKQIYVYRDPRDVYEFARTRNIRWIPHDDVESFITWTRICYGNGLFDTNCNKYLSIRYEDLIFDYDNQINIIENYLGISPLLHIMPKCCFDPAISCKYVGLWKTSTNGKEDFDKIIKELPQYCYLI